MDLTPVLKLNLPAFAFEPWDDEVNDNFDVLDAFVGSVVGMHNYAGIWENNTPYTVGQQVIDTTDSSFWACNVSHLSATDPVSFLTDRANHPSYWSLKQNSAKQYADQAASSAQAAAASAAAAQAAFNAIMPDAPRDDTMYGRINGLWRQAVAIDSPFFQGDPRAPTPALSDNDNSIATTAFVKGIVGTSAAFVTIGDLPPASPSIGSLWWDDIGGQLYVYYYDSNSYQWVAVNSATGGQGTGFMPIVGGVFTGPVTLANTAITANLHAATKQYVDNTVNNKSYPYLPLIGGTVAGPLTVTGVAAFSSTLSATGDMSTSGTLTAASTLRTNNGRIMNYAPNYAPTITLWRGDVGARGMWSNGNDIAFGQLDGAGTAIASYGGFDTNNNFYTQGSINCLGAVWATNRYGAFGLQDFGGGYWGMRFSTDGWRLQWNSATGSLSFSHPNGTWLMSVDGSGNANFNGQVVASTVVYGSSGVRFGWQNGWEYGAYVDGAGNQIFAHRGGYYEYWSTSGGDSHWVKNGSEVMYLTTAGDAGISRNFNAAGGVYTGYVSSSGNINAAGAFTGNIVSVNGNVNGNASFMPSGFFAGGGGDTDMGFYRSGGNRIDQRRGNWYWLNDGAGNESWTAGGNLLWGQYWSGSYAGYPMICFSTHYLGAGSGMIASMSASAQRREPRISRGLADIMRLGVAEYQLPDAPATDLSDVIEHAPVLRIVPEHVLDALPEAARRGDEGIGVDITTIMAVMVNAIKELGARVIALEAH